RTPRGATGPERADRPAHLGRRARARARAVLALRKLGSPPTVGQTPEGVGFAAATAPVVGALIAVSGECAQAEAAVVLVGRRHDREDVARRALVHAKRRRVDDRRPEERPQAGEPRRREPDPAVVA